MPDRPTPGSPQDWLARAKSDLTFVLLPLPVGAFYEDLCSWAEGQSDDLAWGTGRERGSFSFHYHQDGKPVSVFSVLTDGELWLNLNSMAPKLPLEVLQEFHRALHEIPGFAHIPADFGEWPVVRVGRVFVNQPEALAAFKSAVVQLGKRIHPVG